MFVLSLFINLNLLQLLKELTASLKEFGKDDDCYVVAITSDSSESFCEGLDYRVLLSDDEATRKKKATEVASLVKYVLNSSLVFFTYNTCLESF